MKIQIGYVIRIRDEKIRILDKGIRSARRLDRYQLETYIIKV